MEPSTRPARSLKATLLATAATAATLTVLDLTFLGVVARRFYADELGSLKRAVPIMPAAGLFYAMYIAATVRHAVLGASSPADAAKRGAGLGTVAYGTYELTNLAVLKDWPLALVPVDIAWGVALTSVASFVGKVVHQKVSKTAQ